MGPYLLSGYWPLFAGGSSWCCNLVVRFRIRDHRIYFWLRVVLSIRPLLGGPEVVMSGAICRATMAFNSSRRAYSATWYELLTSRGAPSRTGSISLDERSWSILVRVLWRRQLFSFMSPTGIAACGAPCPEVGCLYKLEVPL